MTDASTSRVVNKRSGMMYEVYVGRPSWWGNPFTHQSGETLAKYKVATRDEAVAKYREWVLTSHDEKAVWIRKNVHRLKGKTLGCWCAPKPCHGDVLVELAEGSGL